MAGVFVKRAATSGRVVTGIDLVICSHDLGRAPSLVNAQIANDIRRLEASIRTRAGCETGATCNRGWRIADVDCAGVGAGVHATDVDKLRRTVVCLFAVDNLRDAALFSGDRRREAVAELRSVTRCPPAAVTGVGSREDAPVRRRRHAVEVKERLRQTDREPCPLDEGAVRAELVGRRVEAKIVVFRPTAM